MRTLIREVMAITLDEEDRILLVLTGRTCPLRCRRYVDGIEARRRVSLGSGPWSPQQYSYPIALHDNRIYNGL
jgi:hypothetical protein